MKSGQPVGYLLSPQQQAIATHAGEEEGESSILVLRWTGIPSEDALRNAVLGMVERHEILRTQFPMRDGQSTGEQWVAEYSADAAAAHVSTITPTESNAPADRLLEELRRDARNQEDRLSWKVLFHPISTDLGYVGIRLDGMVADWGTFRLFVLELGAALGTADVAIESDPFPYADYATWQVDLREQAPRRERPVASDFLPFDFPVEGPAGSGSASFSGNQWSSDSRLESRCLAACFSVLARLRGEESFSLAVSRDGRCQREIFGMMGPTEESLWFTADLDQSFGALQTSAEGFSEHQREEAERTAPVQFQFVHLPVVPLGEGGCLEPVQFWEEARKGCRVRMLCVQAGDSLHLRVFTRGGYLDASARDFSGFLVDQIALLLKGGEEVSDRLVKAIPFPSEDGEESLRSVIEVPDRPTVMARIRHQVERSPEAIAISYQGREHSYRELWEASSAVSRRLRALGLEPGDVVGIEGERSFGLVASIVGTLLSRGVLLTLDPALPADRRADLCEEAGIRFFLAVGEAEGQREVDSIPILSVRPSGAMATTTPESDSETVSEEEEFLAVATMEPAYVFFTSGTTGKPKKVVGNHRGLAHFIEWQGEEFGVSDQDRVAQLTGLSFDVLLRDLFLPLCHGSRLCLPPEDSLGVPDLLFDWMQRERITLLHLVPSIVAWWLQGTRDLPRLSSLRLSFFAGEPLSASLVERWKSAVASDSELINLYGPTETTLAKAFYHLSESPEEGTQPIGSALPGVDLLVWNAENSPCLPGEVGEIVIRTPYRSSPEETGGIDSREPGFFANPFREDDDDDLLYRSGDLGRRRFDGALEILGRKDDQGKIRGVRFSPLEIQSALESRDELEQCLVLRKEGEGGDAALVAFVTARENEEVDTGELRRFLFGKIPAALVPETIQVLARFPLTPNGKVDREALPAMGKPPERTRKPPENALQERLLVVWKDLFGREEIGITEHFLDLGGHSLLAAQLTARLQEELGRSLPLGLVFEAPTIEQLAERIESAPENQFSPGLPPRLREGESAREAPLSQSQRRLWFQHLIDPDSGTYHLPIAVRIQGELETDRLADCLQFLIRRHAILRTVFRENAGQLRQEILPAWEVELPIEEASSPDSDPAAQDRELRELATLEARKPFDLHSAPSTRFRLWKRNSREHVLLINLHHLVGDGWSSVLLLRELEACYRDRAEGKPMGASLTPLPFSYADFAAWEEGAARNSHPEYWEKRLEGAAENADFPTDRPRTSRTGNAGREITLHLSASLSERLRNLGQEESATLFVILLGALQGFLFRITGREEVILGTPVANRPVRETESLVGCFINTLPMRGRLAGDASFREVLGRTREKVLADFEHQSCPFEEIVRIARPVRRPGVHPLFQVLLNVLNFDPLPHPEGEPRFERIFPAVPSSNFDWTIYVREGEEIELQFVFDQERFEEDRMRARVDGFHRFLTEVTKHPDAPLSDPVVAESCLFSEAGETGGESSSAPVSSSVRPDEEEVREIRETVTEIWSRLLPSEGTLDPDDNFFERGGHSMLAMEIAYRMGQEFGVVVPLRWMLEYPTVAEISPQIAHLLWHLKPSRAMEEAFEI